MIKFVLSNSLHYIENACEVVDLVMDLIKMNCYWGGHKDRTIVPNLRLLWQITHLGHLSQISFCTLKEKRCLGLSRDLLIVLQAQMKIPIVLTVNFSRPWVYVPIVEPNVVEDVHIQQSPSSSNDLLPLLSWSGMELKENICVDGQWHIEYCPPKFVIQCSTFQKIMALKCKAMINLYKLVNGTFAPCYLGLWVEYHSKSLKHHNHWFCPNDLNHYVGGVA